MPLSEINSDSLLESIEEYFMISLLIFTNPVVAGFPSNSANDAVAFPPLAGSSSNAIDVDKPTAAFNITGEVVGNTFEISNLLFPECIP